MAREKDNASRAVIRATTLFGTLGFALFSYVWWPIQAERHLAKLKKLETEISQKKAELHGLQSRYAAMTSLAALDQWAKANGPWKHPTPNDVIVIAK